MTTNITVCSRIPKINTIFTKWRTSRQGYENIFGFSQQLIYLGSIYRFCLNITMGVAVPQSLVWQIRELFLSIQNTPLYISRCKQCLGTVIPPSHLGEFLADITRPDSVTLNSAEVIERSQEIGHKVQILLSGTICTSRNILTASQLKPPKIPQIILKMPLTLKR